MSRMRRFLIDENCVFAERFDSTQGLEDRGFTIASNPTVCKSPIGHALNLDGTDDKLTWGNVSGTIKTVAMYAYLASTTEQLLDFDSGTTYLDATSGTLAVANCGDETLYVNDSQTATVTADAWKLIGFTSATGITVSNLQIGTDNTDFGEIKVSYVILATRVWSAWEFSNLWLGKDF